MCLVDMAKMDPSIFLFEEEVCAAVVPKRRRKRQTSTKKWVQSEAIRRSWEALWADAEKLVLWSRGAGGTALREQGPSSFKAIVPFAS